MRILEAITPSGIGGAEIFVVDLCRMFGEVGVDVDVFCPEGRPFVRFASEKGVPSTNWKTTGKFDPRTVFLLRHLMVSRRVDILHTHLSTASMLGALAARLAGVPSIAHVHGLNSARCFKHSTGIIAVCNAVKAHICAQGIPDEKVVVIHNGVDLHKFAPRARHEARIRLGFETSAPLIGVFGRLSPEKGQAVALNALPILIARFPGLKMIFVGRGRDGEALEALADRLGVSKSVRFEGFVSDVRDHIAACDAVLIPSFKEGLPLTALEVMAMRRPLVASSVGGLVEVVMHGETGFTVPPNDPRALAEAAEKALEDRALAEEMGDRARERVEVLFEFRKQTERLLCAMKKAGLA